MNNINNSQDNGQILEEEEDSSSSSSSDESDSSLSENCYTSKNPHEQAFSYVNIQNKKWDLQIELPRVELGEEV